MASLAGKRLFLLDMDGTLYLDDRLFPKVPEFLSLIRRRGGRYLFLTNNSSRGVEGYIEKLGRMGIATEPSDYMTSADAAQHTLLTEFAGRNCYVSGTASLKRQLAEAGVDVTDVLSDDIDLLLSGFDTELTFQKLEDSCILLNRGVTWLATNPDWVCPTDQEVILVDCGSICKAIEGACKRKPDVVIGKPNPNMLYCIRDKYGYKSDELAMVGDRIYTDVATAQNAGSLGVLVLSGETTLETAIANDPNPDLTAENIEVLGELLVKSRKK